MRVEAYRLDSVFARKKILNDAVPGEDGHEGKNEKDSGKKQRPAE